MYLHQQEKKNYVNPKQTYLFEYFCFSFFKSIFNVYNRKNTEDSNNVSTEMYMTPDQFITQISEENPSI